MAVTRKFLRQSIGAIVGDLDIFTATSGGTTTTFVDALNGHVENNSLVAREGIFSGGTAGNLNSVVRVTANVKSTTTLTFTPAVATSTASGDTFELYNRDGQGPKIHEIHNAINRCISFVSGSVLTEVVSSESTFDVDSPSITIPASWVRLTHVEYQDLWDDQWYAIHEADWRPGVDRVAKTVTPDNIPRFYMDTAQVRLRGYTEASEMSTDASTTLVDAEWLIHEAASQLLLRFATSERVGERRAADYRATSQYLHLQANTYRSKNSKTLRGSTGVVLVPS